MAQLRPRVSRRLRNGGRYTLPDGSTVMARRLPLAWLLRESAVAEYEVTPDGSILRCRRVLPPGARGPLRELTPTGWSLADLVPVPR